MGGPISTQSLCKHLIVDVLWPREAMQSTMAGMNLANFMKNHQICKIVDRFVEKRASGAKHQIRTAAPHFEMCLGQ